MEIHTASRKCYFCKLPMLHEPDDALHHDSCLREFNRFQSNSSLREFVIRSFYTESMINLPKSKIVTSSTFHFPTKKLGSYRDDDYYLWANVQYEFHFVFNEYKRLVVVHEYRDYKYHCGRYDDLHWVSLDMIVRFQDAEIHGQVFGWVPTNSNMLKSERGYRGPGLRLILPENEHIDVLRTTFYHGY